MFDAEKFVKIKDNSANMDPFLRIKLSIYCSFLVWVWFGLLTCGVALMRSSILGLWLHSSHMISLWFMRIIIITQKSIWILGIGTMLII
jgi:hypothetical protein